MALIEEFEKTGNWLFKGRSFFPLLLYVFMAAIIGFQLDPFFQTFDPVSAVACIAISLFGQLIRALTIGYTPRGTSGRNTKDGQIAEVLNTKGMYNLVRHPLYLGNYFMWLGIMVYVGNVVRGGVQPHLLVVLRANHVCRGGLSTANSPPPLIGRWVPSFCREPSVDGPDVQFSSQRPEARVQRLFAIFVSLAVISAAKHAVRGATPGWTSSSPLAIHAARYVHRVLHTPQPQRYSRVLHGRTVRNFLFLSQQNGAPIGTPFFSGECRANRRPLACRAL